MNRIFAAIMLLLCAGCEPPHPGALEQAPPRIKAQEMARFEITLESTPRGYPDLYLIKDSETGSEVLLFTYGNNSYAAVLLPKKEVVEK